MLLGFEGHRLVGLALLMLVRHRFMVLEGIFDLRMTNLATAIPILFSPLLIKELLILLFFLKLVFQFGVLLLLKFVFFNKSSVLLLYGCDLRQVLVKMLRKLLSKQLIHILLEALLEFTQLLISSLSSSGALLGDRKLTLAII